jgi:putative glutamine amidotransferase
VHEVGHFLDHREDKNASIDVQYNTLAHRIQIQAGGCLAQLWPQDQEVMVNSLHGQGIETLAPGLRIEAVAEDGLIEAFSVMGAKSFALAVQWHPEWQWHPSDQVGDFPFYRAIFKAFGDACRARHAQRLASLHP